MNIISSGFYLSPLTVIGFVMAVLLLNMALSAIFRETDILNKLNLQSSKSLSLKTVLSLIAAAYIFRETKELGWIGVLTSVVSGGLVVVLATFIGHEAAGDD